MSALQGSTPHPAIEAIAVTKRYGSTVALKGISCSVRAGDVQAIAGENGAGKSTFVKIISGVIPVGRYDGEIKIAGRTARFSSVRDAEQSGVFLVPQELHIIPELSVADYLFLNREPQRAGFVRRAALWQEASKWLRTFRLSCSPLEKMGSLRSHEQQLVSIARAMTQGVKLLILDEPTASLTGNETDLLFDRVREFRNLGVTTLYISHRLNEFDVIADAVTVMRDGSVVDEFAIDRKNPTPQRIVRGMVGRDLTDLYPKVRAPCGEAIFSVTKWSIANPVHGRRPLVTDISLELRRGEVVGIFGLIGSGASDFARSLFAAHSGKVSGEATLAGRRLSLSSPRDAMAAGIAYLPSDRKRDGLVLGMSVAANLTLASLNDFLSLNFIDRKRELVTVSDYVRSLRIKTASIEQPVGDLSGGNQQKVAAAKWLRSSPDVVIFEEPTRGVDVGARVEIYNLINEVAKQQRAVLIISTDLPEVIGMSDRVLAMRDGVIAGEWDFRTASEAKVMLAAVGGDAA